MNPPPGGQVLLERRGGVLALVIDHPPVNASTVAVRQGLIDGLETLTADSSLAAGVLVGRSGNFVAGSDLCELADDVPPPLLTTVISHIEACPKPVVAAIDGAALGGGLELAMACDRRVATPKVLLGLPEVSLGMVPGAGGTQRLPRLVGPAVAADLILTGRRLDGPSALRLGLVDAVVSREHLLAEAMIVAKSTHKSSALMRRVPAEDPRVVEQAITRGLLAAGQRPHAVAAAELIRRAGEGDVIATLADERRIFDEFRKGSEAAALCHLFFAERAAAWPSELRGVAATPVAQATVIGADAERAAVVLQRAGVRLVEMCSADVVVVAGDTLEDVVACASGPGRNIGLALPPGDASTLEVVEVLRTAGTDATVVRGLLNSLVGAGIHPVLPHRGRGPIGPLVHDAESWALAAEAVVRQGVARSVDDVDVLMVRGYGFPRHLGGPAYYGRHCGR